ncbi:ATP-binding cassette domain-containing protein [Spirochaeta cellobiosiphila]|uniref:ATP-binding cassette domain-containing protein n=1 Tax=Spirochaeta cellobiosiphila TaxID=504483 RepID=UPI0003F9984B|nr:ATP-binding cassette domain-containing protein [Spirochaeta cellobiosiphila]
MIDKTKLVDIRDRYPYIDSFFLEHDISIEDNDNLILEDLIQQSGHDAPTTMEKLHNFLQEMESFLKEDQEEVQSITIYPGTNKAGETETFEKLVLKAGEVTCLVGPTGSGKSRLLGDIEWVAQGDTPTSRRIMINGEIPDSKWRFSLSNKLVAQLSQNMNFVMDMSVEEFLRLHGESRLVNDLDKVVQDIWEQAIALAGEPFTLNTPITSLSGGQSRALMIADTAILSQSPVILIDEIENAGIDRKKALELLIKKDKIILMATHDPVLALLGDRRIVIKNGGIHKVINTTTEERTLLDELEDIDRRLNTLRHKLRLGDTLQ